MFQHASSGKSTEIWYALCFDRQTQCICQPSTCHALVLNLANWHQTQATKNMVCSSKKSIFFWIKQISSQQICPLQIVFALTGTSCILRSGFCHDNSSNWRSCPAQLVLFVLFLQDSLNKSTMASYKRVGCVSASWILDGISISLFVSCMYVYIYISETCHFHRFVDKFWQIDEIERPIAIGVGTFDLKCSMRCINAIGEAFIKFPNIF